MERSLIRDLWCEQRAQDLRFDPAVAGTDGESDYCRIERAPAVRVGRVAASAIAPARSLAMQP